MMDDLEQKLKEGLLEDLISHMSSGMGERMKPKGMAVEVSAPSKDKLAQGLDKAKDVLGSVPDKLGDEPDSDEADGMAASGDDDSDEARLMQLLGDDDEDDKKYRG